MTERRHFRFDRFTLDLAERRLLDGDRPVALNARYLDALALLVSDAGSLVSKDQFMDTVWRGVPVTDEALTQCIRALRRAIGDDAANPRFIETVPKHGYRFVADVQVDAPVELAPGAPSDRWPRWALVGAAGIGGGFAGLAGGIAYGLGGASQAGPEAFGAGSALIVLTGLCMLLGAAAGIALGLGMMVARLLRPGWSGAPIAGAAIAGFVIGAVTEMLGADAFGLLIGRSPGDVTGAGEGALLGAAVGLAVWAAHRRRGGAGPVRAGAYGAGAGLAAGLLIPLFGGRLMAGSLAALTERFPESRLRLDAIGAVFGEQGFGFASQTATSAFEATLFGGCVLFAVTLAERQLSGPDPG